jgi:ribosomal protein S18 acetylase RimI-like enzyme
MRGRPLGARRDGLQAMSPALTLRPALDADLAFCESLSRSNMATYHSARDVAWDAERFIANWARFENFMVLADEQVAGFLRLLAIDGALEIRDLQLLPSHRNQGIGSWAVAQAMSEAAARGTGMLRLRVFVENPAIRLYARLGFKVDAIDDDGKVHMSHALAPPG